MTTLEEQSFRNLVQFYEAILRTIIRGQNAKTLFTENTRGRLRKHGVLEVVGAGCLQRVLPTAKAMEVLESYERRN